MCCLLEGWNLNQQEEERNSTLRKNPNVSQMK